MQSRDQTKHSKGTRADRSQKSQAKLAARERTRLKGKEAPNTLLQGEVEMSSQEGHICPTHTVEAHGLHSPSWGSETVSGFQEWELRERHYRSPEQWNGAPSTPPPPVPFLCSKESGSQNSHEHESSYRKPTTCPGECPRLRSSHPSTSSAFFILCASASPCPHSRCSNQRPSHSSAWEIDSDGSLLGSLARLPLSPQHQLTAPSLHPPHAFRTLRWLHFPPCTSMCLPPLSEA